MRATPLYGVKMGPTVQFFRWWKGLEAGLSLAVDGQRGYGLGMMDWIHCPVVERVPDKVSGAWLFKNTRVPVRALFENLEGGATVEQFLEWFPGVTREQVLTVLKFTESSLADVVA